MSAGRKLTSQEGQRVPNVVFHTRRKGEWTDVSSDEIFAGKTVVVFSLPGAFTPTCSSSHVPRFNELAPVLCQNGVDEIVCVSVNDAYVMEAWSKDENAGNLTFLPDGNGEFTQGMGMLVDKEYMGAGMRSWRYSMLVRDSVIRKQFIEPDEPGDPFHVSDAETMLRFVNIDAVLPPDVLLLVKEGCGWCEKARLLLARFDLTYTEFEVKSKSPLRAIGGKDTSPQIMINGQLVGGYQDLEKALGNNDFLFNLGLTRPEDA